jgi:hypothetical protein
MSNNVEQVTESLFSVSGTSRHSTDKHDLEAGQRVEFRGSGAILSVVFEGFADESKVPVRIYKVTADNLELI